jgi:hypothetical protein
VVVVKLRTGLLALTGVVVACAPTLSDTASLITGPRILGVQSVPAEAAPKASLALTALVVDDKGPVTADAIHWDYCTARNPLANLGPVNPVCQEYGNAALVPIGVGPQASGKIPDIACRQFGPEVPEPVNGQPAGRPVDPDATGGYYQPVSVFAPSSGGPVVGIYLARLTCGVSGAGPTQAAQYNSRYRFNENPQVMSLGASGRTLDVDSSGKTNSIPTGQKLQLTVTWPTCPVTDVCGDGVCGPDETKAECPKDCTVPKGCAGAERYVNFDLTSQTVVDAREGIHVSWFATGGSFDLDRTGTDGSDTDTSSTNGWQPPSSGPVHLWVVLHDDRGGIGWAGYALTVQ